MPHSPQAVWRALPENIRNRLLLGGDGQARLLDIAESLMAALGSSTQAELLAEILCDMLLAAWELDFYNARAASVLCQAQEQRPFLTPQAAAFARECALARPGAPEDARKLDSLYRNGDIAGIKGFLDQRRAAEPNSLFWPRFALRLGFQSGEPGQSADWLESWLEHPGLPPEFQSLARADHAFGQGDCRAALAGYERAFAQTNLPGLLLKRGECLLRLGDRNSALELFLQAVKRRPWQSNLLLRATDLLAGLDSPDAPPPGRGVILLYSWNHAPDLDACLRALAASELGDCRIALLDNGSTDLTPGIAAAWKDRLGDGLEVITLPVNVGAPAARNWLLSLPEAKDADWVIFLDDDALVPPDWLGYFGKALKTRPEAGIVGCRVADQASPLVLQSVDLHFDERATEAPEAGLSPVHAHAEGPDFGQYSYMRPCVSVTGCCHLLTRKSLDKHNGFDLRFSPSQFDDLERDLRSALDGDFPLYQGHLRVLHIKRSGLAANIPPKQQANIAGNMCKLRQSINADQIADLQRADCAGLRADLFTKLGNLPNIMAK